MKVFALAIVLLFLTSCDEELDTPQFTDPNPNDVELRVNNKSNYNLDSVSVDGGNTAILFNSISRNRTTNFRSFISAYDEMKIRFKIGEKRFLHLPNSSRSKLESGKYELQLDQIDSTNLSFTFLLTEVN